MISSVIWDGLERKRKAASTTTKIKKKHSTRYIPIHGRSNGCVTDSDGLQAIVSASCSPMQKAHGQFCERSLSLARALLFTCTANGKRVWRPSGSCCHVQMHAFAALEQYYSSLFGREWSKLEWLGRLQSRPASSLPDV